MNGIKAAETMIVPGALLAASMTAWAPPVQAARVQTTERACAQAKARVSAVRHFPVSAIRSCDTISATDIPEGYYVLALHGFCREEICGSTLMGWFAVQKATGCVFEWDVADWRLGPSISVCFPPLADRPLTTHC
jgi:hypothetical protein